MNNFLLAAATTAASGATGAEGDLSTTIWTYITMFGPLLILVVVMYFIMIRPQKKKQKEEENMRNNIQIGDEITTIGGIVGIVVRKGEDTIVLETGGDRSKIRVKLWAVQSNATVHDAKEE